MRLYLTSVAANVLDHIPLQGRVAFITTAADPYHDKSFVTKDREALLRQGLDVIDVDLKLLAPEKIKDFFAPFPIIFVCGGNTFYLLEHLRISGFAQHCKALLKDKTYIGSSAGSIVTSPDIAFVKTLDDPSIATLTDYRGLALVDFLLLPHHGNEKYHDCMERIMAHDYQWPVETLTDQEYVVVDQGIRQKYTITQKN